MPTSNDRPAAPIVLDERELAALAGTKAGSNPPLTAPDADQDCVDCD